MRLRRHHRAAIAAAVSLTLGASIAEAASIGVNFRRANGDQLMDAADSAGLVPQTNWNNTDGAAAGTMTNIVGGALVNDAGAATGASLRWQSANTWSAPNGTTTGNHKLFGGYIDNSGGSPLTFVDLDNVPYAHYDVYAYVGSDGNGRTGTAAIIGKTPVGFSTFSNPLPDPPFVSAPDGPSTYVKFEGLTGPSFRLANLRGNNNSGFHGLQIVERTDPAPVTPPHVTPNLLAHYAFEGNLNDSGPNAAHAAPQGEATTAPGLVGNALSLDGTRDFAEVVPAPEALKPTQTLAISAYVNRQDANAGEVVSLGDHYGLRINDNGSIHFFYDTNPTGNSWTGLTTDAAQADEIIPNDGTWHHIVAQKTPTHLEVWIDGKLADGAQAQWPTTAAIDYAGLGNNLNIGAHANGGTGQDWGGMIDEVRIYDGPLSAAEIRTLSAAVPEPGTLMVLAVAAVPLLRRRRR